MPKKATPEEIKAEVELQLSQRRFVLESINTAATLIQVPIVTAGIWYFLSRTNPALGALNKAILAAELAPIIGDIKFPEGVLLGAAMESTEDFLNILQGEGLLKGLGETAERVISRAEEVTIDTGDLLAEFFMPKGMKLKSCEDLNQKLHLAHLAAKGWMLDPEGQPVADPNAPTGLLGEGVRAAATLEFGMTLKAMKNNGCDKPTHPYYATDKMWMDI